MVGDILLLWPDPEAAAAPGSRLGMRWLSSVGGASWYVVAGLGGRDGAAVSGRGWAAS